MDYVKISLYEALKLTQPYNLNNIVWMREKENRTSYSFKELKPKLNLKNTMIYRISPCFICNDYEEFEFAIKGKGEKE